MEVMTPHDNYFVCALIQTSNGPVTLAAPNHNSFVHS